MADRGLPGVFLLSICQSGTAAETPTEKECLVLPCRRTVIPVWHPPQQPGLSVPSDMCSGTSVVSDSVTPWTVPCQAPLSVRFSRQEYWSGLPFPSPGVRSHIPYVSCIAGGFFTISTTWETPDSLEFYCPFDSKTTGRHCRHTNAFFY